MHVLKMSDGRPERQLAAGAPVTSLACLPPEATDSVMGVVLLGEWCCFSVGDGDGDGGRRGLGGG